MGDQEKTRAGAITFGEIVVLERFSRRLFCFSSSGELNTN